MVTLLKRITSPAEPDAVATIRDTSITVDQVHQELMLRTPESLILTKFRELDSRDIQAVWVYKAFQNSRYGVIDRQELISTLNALPEKVSLLQLYDHIDLIFQIQNGIAESVEGKGIPHEQVMREMKEHIAGLKTKANTYDD